MRRQNLVLHDWQSWRDLDPVDGLISGFVWQQDYILLTAPAAKSELKAAAVQSTTSPTCGLLR